MIVYKIIKLQAVGAVSPFGIQIFYRMGNFKIIMVVVPGIQRLVQLIIRHGMQRPLIDPARIIAVNYFAHQPELRLHFLRHRTKRMHIVKIQHIRRIQTDPVDIKFTNPEPYHITDIVPDRRIMLI